MISIPSPSPLLYTRDGFIKYDVFLQTASYRIKVGVLLYNLFYCNNYKLIKVRIGTFKLSFQYITLTDDNLTKILLYGDIKYNDIQNCSILHKLFHKVYNGFDGSLF